MNWDTQDVICAVASPKGGALRGIVRITGPTMARVLSGVFRPSGDAATIAAIRRPTALHGDLHLSRLERQLPATLYLWPTARSYTCQPLAELHTLGSPVLLEAVVGELLHRGARHARPGEFTLRAFLGGRLDLSQAEAVRSVIDAGGDEQLLVALGQLAGGLRGPIQQLRDRLLELCAHLEAGLDFAEEDITFLQPDAMIEQLQRARAALASLAAQLRDRSTQRPAYRAVLVGSPNVGKSSLFNALVGRAAALVSTQAGTTRDYLTAPLRLRGATLELVDTAGLDYARMEPSGSLLDRAQQSGRQVAEQADVQLYCLDASRPPNRWEWDELTRADRSRIVLLTKCDLNTDGPALQLDRLEPVRTSAQSGEGLEEVKVRLTRQLGVDFRASRPTAAQTVPVVEATAARCRDSLIAAGEAVDRALHIAQQAAGDELVAAEVRCALDELGKVGGAVYTDDILDRVFSRFCIGK
jgi:tRNA modification GTPase